MKLTEYEEKLKISNCPICGNKHSYKLKIETIGVFNMAIYRHEKSDIIYRTRVLICPIKKETFQATISFNRPSDGKIGSIFIENID